MTERDGNQAIADRAAECYLALQDATLGAARRQTWLAWLQQPEHQRAFDEVVQLWELLERAAPLEMPSPDELAADRGDARGPSLHPAAAPQRPRRRAVVAAAAAAMLLAAVLGGVTVADWGGLFHHRERFETRPAQLTTVLAPDGSKITLAGDSLVEIDFSRGERVVRLRRGHAFFDVAHETKRPFVVHSDGGSTTALGTQFDVNRLDDDVTVTLVRGLVSVAATNSAGRHDRRSTLLGKGERVSYRQGSLGQIEEVNLEHAVSWREGVLTFVDEPLSRAIEEINRYRTRRIYFRGEDLAGLTVSGTVHLDRTDEWLTGLTQGYPVKLVQGGTAGLLLSRRADHEPAGSVETVTDNNHRP